MNKSFYFQHDYNASNDAKMLFLRQQLGMEGYGIFWFIIEQLAQSGGFLPMKIIPVLAMQTQTQETKVRAVIEGYELFQISDNQFFSMRLNTQLNYRKMLSECGKNGMMKRWGNNPPNNPPINPLNNKERKGKERKGEKGDKEKEIFEPPTISEISTHMQNKLDDFTALSQAELFFNHYESNGWMVGKNKMKNWKASASGWVNRMNQYTKIKTPTPVDPANQW